MRQLNSTVRQATVRKPTGDPVPHRKRHIRCGNHVYTSLPPNLSFSANVCTPIYLYHLFNCFSSLKRAQCTLNVKLGTKI
jgi:hypothetical protein